MILKTKLYGHTYSFYDAKYVIGKANKERSGVTVYASIVCVRHIKSRLNGRAASSLRRYLFCARYFSEHLCANVIA